MTKTTNEEITIMQFEGTKDDINNIMDWFSTSFISFSRDPENNRTIISIGDQIEPMVRLRTGDELLFAGGCMYKKIRTE